MSRSKPKLKPVHRQQYYNIIPLSTSTTYSHRNSTRYSNTAQYPQNGLLHNICHNTEQCGSMVNMTCIICSSMKIIIIGQLAVFTMQMGAATFKVQLSIKVTPFQNCAILTMLYFSTDNSCININESRIVFTLS